MDDNSVTDVVMQDVLQDPIERSLADWGSTEWDGVMLSAFKNLVKLARDNRLGPAELEKSFFSSPWEAYVPIPDVLRHLFYPPGSDVRRALCAPQRAIELVQEAVGDGENQIEKGFVNFMLNAWVDRTCSDSVCLLFLKTHDAAGPAPGFVVFP